jgi:hypothetical protein
VQGYGGHWRVVMDEWMMGIDPNLSACGRFGFYRVNNTILHSHALPH